MQQTNAMTAAGRLSQVVELLSTGILRVLAGRALERDSWIEAEPPAGSLRPTATPSRPTAVRAGR